MLLIVSAVLSSILLAVFGIMLAQKKKPGFGACLLAGFLTIGPIMLGCLFPCLLLQAVVLLALAIADAFGQFKPRTYFTAACVGTVLVYFGFGLQQAYALYLLQQQFPYESMEARLPPVRPRGPLAGKASVGQGLDSVEEKLDERLPYVSRGWNGGRRRNWKGCMRMPWGRSSAARDSASGACRTAGCQRKRCNATSAKKGGIRNRSQGTRTCYRTATPAHHSTARINLVSRSCIRKVFSISFIPKASAISRTAGTWRASDRTNSATPKCAGWWKLASVELVGLVVHEKPVAYVSDLLPRMDVLRQSPIRELDAFETQGLAALQDAGTLFLRLQSRRLRLLGAIRATKQCTTCHECERGDLLGAFSYVLANP